MKTQILLLLACFIIVCPQADAREIALYLEDSTLAVARIDLKELSVPQAIKTIEALSPGMLPQPIQTSANLIGGGLVESLKGEGVEHIYVTLSTVDIIQMRPAVFIPSSDSPKVVESLKAVVAMLPADWQYEVSLVDGGVMVATPATTARLLSKPNSHRPELDNALMQTPATLTLAVGVREDLRQSAANVLSEHPPWELPVPFSLKQVVSDFRSMSLQLALTEMVLRIELSTVDLAAKQRTAELVQQYVSLILPDLRVSSSDEKISLILDQNELQTLFPVVSQAGVQSQASMQEANNLKQIVLGMWNFEATHHGLPPRMSVAEDGTPLLSWRVHLLPFIDGQTLYDQFHLDEPWDSPHNIKLLHQIPFPYQSREYVDLKPGYTCVVEPLCEGSTWAGTEPSLLRIGDIHDGTSNTLAFIVAPPEKAVPWTKPSELTVDLQHPIESLFGDRETLLFSFLDGSVQRLERSRTSAQRLLAALTHQGSEVMSLEE